MAWTVLTESSPGAPDNLSVNGSLNNVLRWALPALGWAVEYGPTGNSSVFRSPTGNRLRLLVRHESSITGQPDLSYVRGAHTATSATAIGQPFPTATQAPNANSTWGAGTNGQPAVPAPYIIAGNDQFFYYFVDSGYGNWDIAYFGQVPSAYNTAYDTVILVRNSGDAGFPSGLAAATYAHPFYSNTTFWARGINGTTVSVGGGLQAGNGSGLGMMSGCPPMRGGYQNRILRGKIPLSDSGSVTATAGVLALPNRGWLPNLWFPWHNGSGGVAPGDTFTDTAYNPAASFTVIANTIYKYNVILETTDTWVMPL